MLSSAALIVHNEDTACSLWGCNWIPILYLLDGLQCSNAMPWPRRPVPG